MPQALWALHTLSLILCGLTGMTGKAGITGPILAQCKLKPGELRDLPKVTN